MSVTTDPIPCDIDELRTLFLFEKLNEEQLDWLCQPRPHHPRRTRAGLRRGRRRHLLLCPAQRHPGDVEADRWGRRRGDQVVPGRGVHRRLAGLHGRARAEDLRQLVAGHRAVPTARARRRRSGVDHEGMVPDGGPPAGGPVLGTAEHPADHRPAGTTARPGLAVGGAHSRTEQSGRGGRAGHLRSAQPGGRHAAQAGRHLRRFLGPGDARAVDPAAGKSRRAGRQGAHPVADGSHRPGGRAGRMVRGPRHRRRVGSGSDVRAGRAGR